MNVNLTIVRRFGNGDDLKKVITETIGGKTITRVFDNSGKELINRVKTITVQHVGDKIVKTKDVETVKNVYATEKQKCKSLGIKQKFERVYNANGKLLGGKITQLMPEVQINSEKSDVKKINPIEKINAKDYFVTRYSGKLKRRFPNLTITKICNGIRYFKNTRGVINESSDFNLFYNNKGLPIPPALYLSGKGWQRQVPNIYDYARKLGFNKTVKEMIDAATVEVIKIKAEIKKGYYGYGHPKLSDKIFFNEQKLKIEMPKETAYQKLKRVSKNQNR